MRASDFLICIFSLFFTPVLSVAQKISKSGDKNEWLVIRVMDDRGTDYKHDFNHVFDRYHLPVSETEKIIPTAGKNHWGIVRVNENGKILWQFQGTEDEFLGMGLTGEDVIAFYTNDLKRPKKISAILISGTKGSKIREQVVYEPSSPANTDVRVQNKTNGIFNDLIIVTNEKKEGTSLQLLYIDAGLSPSKPVLLKPSILLTKFAGSIITNTGEILVGDFSEDQLVISQFNKEGKELRKLAAPVARRSNEFTTTLQPDNNNSQAVFIGMNYKTESKDWANQVFRFDFATGKVISSQPELLEKDYAKSLTLEEPKGVMGGSMRWIDEAQIAGMIQWENKLVLIKEIRSSLANAQRVKYINYPWIASIYDANLKVEKTIGLDKRYECFLPFSLSLGFGLQKDKLLIIAPALAGIGTYTVVLVSVDMPTNQIEKTTVVDQFRSSSGNTIEAGATLWFTKSFLLEQLQQAGNLFNGSWNCTFYKFEL